MIVRIHLSASLVACSLLALARIAVAQGSVAGGPPPVNESPASRSPDFGTSGLSSYTLTAFDFVHFSNGTFTPIVNTPNRYFSGNFDAPVRLPNGASIVKVEIEGCDNSASGSINGFLASAAAPANSALVIQQFDTGGSATPGCGNFQTALASPTTVDNAAQKYFIEVHSMPSDGSVYLAAVRIYYKLQVSPGPATATFSDVPTTSPQFKFVEALVSAGITAGCGGGNYCPNQAITRGQMAVFLATALGLNWPN